MADIQVYNNGWVEPTQIKAYQNGWQPVKGLWIYNNGWQKLYPASGSQAFGTVGTGTFTVPNGIYSLNLSYPTTSSGIVSQSVVVYPGQSIDYTVGDYGADGAFGTISIPAFSITTIESGYAGVDSTWHTQFSVATPTAIRVEFNGTVATTTAQVADAGGYWVESNIANHGDLGASGVLNTVPNSVMLGNIQLVFGGDGPSGVSGPSYDAGTDMWLADLEIDDPSYDQNPHNYSLTMQMQVPIILSW
jgi:hypothetical protein